MDCTFERSPKGITCTTCGRSVCRTTNTKIRRVCIHIGVGTWIRETLHSFGFESCQSCCDLASEMDRVGPDAVEDRIVEYARLIVDNASNTKQMRAWVASLVMPTKAKFYLARTLIQNAVAAVRKHKELPDGR